jgi:exonuclease SbcC
MLKTLRLANWTSHRDSTIYFGKGANIFVGVMGSGKSSALEAISFALFGAIPEGSRRKAKLSDLIRFGEDAATVELEMEINGNIYRIIRKINRKEGSEAQLYRGDVLVAQTPSMANKYLEGLLGMNYDLFSTIIYSAQNRIDAFINMPPKGRKEAIDELIGLNGILKVEDNATKVLNRLRLIAKEIASLMPTEAEMESKKRELSALDGSISKWKEEQARLERGASEAKARLSDAAKAYGEVSAKRKEHEGLNARISASKGCLGALESSYNPALGIEREKELLASIGLTKKGNSELEASGKSLLIEANAIRERIANAKAATERRRKAQEEAARLDAMLDKLGGRDDASKAMALCENGIKESNERVGMLGAAAKDARHGLAEIGGAGAKCPVCMSELSGDAKAHIEKEWKAKLAESSKLMKEEETRLLSHSGELEALRERLRRIESCAAKRETLVPQMEGVAHDTGKDADALAAIEKSMEGNRKGTSENASRLAAAEGSLKDTRRNIALSGEIEATRAALSGLEKRISALGYSEDEYRKAEDGYRDVSSSAERARAELEKVRAELAISSRMRADLEAMLKRHGSERERHAKIESAMSDVSLFREALNRMQLILRNSIIGDINLGINEVWRYAYPYNDYGMIRLIGDHDSYNFEVFANGEWRDISLVASGGEKTMSAIALRITLAMVLAPQLSWIVLDEPTHNLDENGIEKLSSLIGERLPDLIEQFVIVTHDSRLMSSGNGNVFRFSREKSGNDPTSVEKIG